MSIMSFTVAVDTLKYRRPRDADAPGLFRHLSRRAGPRVRRAGRVRTAAPQNLHLGALTSEIGVHAETLADTVAKAYAEAQERATAPVHTVRYAARGRILGELAIGAYVAMPAFLSSMAASSRFAGTAFQKQNLFKVATMDIFAAAANNPCQQASFDSRVSPGVPPLFGKTCIPWSHGKEQHVLQCLDQRQTSALTRLGSMLFKGRDTPEAFVLGLHPV